MYIGYVNVLYRNLRFNFIVYYYISILKTRSLLCNHHSLITVILKTSLQLQINKKKLNMKVYKLTLSVLSNSIHLIGVFCWPALCWSKWTRAKCVSYKEQTALHKGKPNCTRRSSFLSITVNLFILVICVAGPAASVETVTYLRTMRTAAVARCVIDFLSSHSVSLDRGPATHHHLSSCA